MNQRWTMRSAIFALCIGSVVVSLFLQTALFQASLRRQIRTESIAENTSSLERMKSDINSFFHDLTSEMLTTYTESDLIGDLRLHSQGDGLLKKYYWRAWYLGRKRYARKNRLLALYLYDNYDRIISSYRYNCQSFPRDMYSSAYKANTQKVLDYVHGEDSQLLVSGYYNPLEKKDILRLVLRLHNYDADRRQLGYLVCEYDSQVLAEIMKKYISSDNVFLWLQPVDDRSIAHIGTAEGSFSTAYRQISKIVQNYYPYNTLEEEYDGYYLIHVSLENYHLEAFAIVPQSLLTAAQQSQTRTLLILALVMILIASVLAFLLSRWISRPIEDMKDTILRIRSGESHLRINPDGWAEELTVLGSQFNEMLDRIQQMMTEEYEYKLLAERTEYKMLQAQINPHFLYNTLNTMSAIANVQNCPLVSGMCICLSAIFRYCLDMTDELSTVQKEIEHTRNYLYVMDVRNGGSIRYEYEIADEVLDCRLPRITLQPIVENAVTHGLRNVRRKDKYLRIRAFRDDKELLLIVEDNGIGMDARHMNRELEENDPKRVESGISIGILNVNARLKKVFGKEYGITIESVSGEGTSVKICVPAQTDTERKDDE